MGCLCMMVMVAGLVVSVINQVVSSWSDTGSDVLHTAAQDSAVVFVTKQQLFYM